MSTRRARIKGIAALPPRRKNAENREKPSAPKVTENEIKSPNIHSNLTTNSETSSPSQTNILSSPKAASNKDSLVNTAEYQKFATSLPKLSLSKETHQKLVSPIEVAEQVSVITAAPNLKSPSNIFTSPVFRSNVEKRPFLSPSPKLINRNVNRATPQKSIEKDRIQNKSKSIEDLAPKSVESIEDYNVPSVPESVTDEALDGIVPLQPVRNAPKPIDLLKSEIISENAEVLFDPIVPLPSPSKVRPKVRPIPRLVPLRRNSIQGSASESEDESRRLLGSGTPVPPRVRHDSQTTVSSTVNREIARVRNDSLSSSVSQLNQPLPPASPLKEKIHKNRRADTSRRLAAMRRRREQTRPEAMTMYDLIFYNPTTNPIVPDQDEVKAKEAAQKESEQSKPEEDKSDDADDPPDPETETEATPVPQIKLGPNGEIILDEQSLVIKQTDTRKMSSSVIREGAWSATGGRYNRCARTADWSPEETVRFYRALAAVGTDFTLMTSLFPKRTRKDLKLKYKKEERLNGALIDKALRSATTFDVERLQDEFSEERAEAERRAERERERLREFREQERRRLQAARKMGVRKSRASKALEAMVMPDIGYSETATADDIIEAKEKQKPKILTRCRKPPNLKTPIPRLPSITPISNKSNSTPTTKTPSNSTIDITDVYRTSNQPTITPTNKDTPFTIPNIPKNIENGSLVVLTVSDPSSPSKKMLQTYIARGPNNLTPIALPPQLLSSVVSYMKKGAPKSTHSSTSSPLLSPVSVDSRTGTPNIIQMNPSPNKRIRHSSYTITQL